MWWYPSCIMHFNQKPEQETSAEGDLKGLERDETLLGTITGVGSKTHPAPFKLQRKHRNVK